MMLKLNRKSSAAVALTGGAFLALPAIAQDALLKSHDGTIEMAVEVLEYDADTIRVASAIGEFSFDRDTVVCEGRGCPVLPSANDTARSEDPTVTLTDKGGSIALTGELVEFTGTEFVLRTTSGEYRLAADTVICTGAACPVVAPPPQAETAAAPAADGATDAPAPGSTVTLRTRVGAVEITGELLEFTGTEYVVLTPTGEFRLKADIAECIGSACPDPSATEVAAAAEPKAAEPQAAAPQTAAPQAAAPTQAPRPGPADRPMVTLTTNVGGIEIAGELLDYTGTEYVLMTPTGEYRLKTDTVSCAGAGCPASAQPATETTVAAAERPAAPAPAANPAPDLEVAPVVTLTTNVGAIEITGRLLDYTGTEYVLFTPTGEYRLQATTVSCSGAGCPGAAAEATVVAAVDPPPVAPELVSFDPARADVRISGADAVGVGLLPSLWRGYADWLGLETELHQLSDTTSLSRFVDDSGNPREVHYVRESDPTRPFAALIEKSAEFGMVARAPDQREAAALRAGGAGDLMDPENNTVVAVESVAMIVHPDNLVDALSIDQIARIYRGEITNWADVGGANAPIVVLSRNDDSGTREVFEQAVAGGTRLWPGPRTVYPEGGSNGMREAVLAEPNAIGYVDFAAADGVKRLNLASSCGLTSVATPFSVKTEEYPLARRHYLFSRPDNLTVEAQAFLEYMRSPASENAVAASNLVNFALERQPQTVAEDRVEFVRTARYDGPELGLALELADDLRDWTRLSTTLRFATGSSRLGTKELADIKRLIAYLGEQPEGTEVAVVGFADSVGEFGANLRLSNGRASLVAQAIRAEGGGAIDGIVLTTKAYSELAPAACNTDENGRRINRRVEIWIRDPQ